MTIRIDSLGMLPLEMLYRLADQAPDIDIVKDEKQSAEGRDYRFNLILKLEDDLYLQAFDKLYSFNGKLPYRGQTNGTPETAPGIEATEIDKNLVFSSQFNQKRNWVWPNNVVDDFPLDSPAPFVSLMFGWRREYSFQRQVIVPPPGQSQPPAADPNSFIRLGVLQDGESGYPYLQDSFKMEGPPRADNPTYPFFILNYEPTGMRLNNQDSRRFFLFSAAEQLLFSMATVRMAKGVNVDNDLQNPTDWEPLPIFTHVIKNEAGVTLYTPSDHGQLMSFCKVDTSVGNGLAGSFPVIYRNSPYFVNPINKPWESARVIGDKGNANAMKNMSVATWTPPIPNDVVTGGPICSDLSLYNEEELRGRVPGVIAVDITMPVGMVGYIGGKQYRVIHPGRMILMD